MWKINNAIWVQLGKKKKQQKLLRKINFFSLKQNMYFEFIWMISYQLSLFSFLRFPDLTYSTKLPLSELPLSKDKYWSIVAYNQSKLCNLLFSMELNHRLKPKGVTCNAVHPGNLIYTSLSHTSWFYWIFFVMARPFAKTPVSSKFCNTQ